MIKFEMIESQPFMQNSYVVWHHGAQSCFVVDPGFEPDKILHVVHREKLTVTAIFNTHGHVDHIAGNAALRQAFPQAAIAIGQGDAAMLRDATLNLSATYGFDILSPEADHLLVDRQTMTLAEVPLLIREIPGHSPGHVVGIFDVDSPAPLVFGGDVLFQDGIGRTDFPGGSLEMLLSGIVEKLLTLPDDTRILPGHGPSTTIGRERSNNPFLQ